MKIQLSPTRIIPDAVTVWNSPGPEVDIVMDLQKLTFREGSITEMYVFHVLEHLFISEVTDTLKNWFKVLAPGADIYILANDTEFISRSFVGGDITIEMINEKFSTPCQFTKELMIDKLGEGNFQKELMRVWYVDVPDKFQKKDYELIVSAKKHG